MYKIQKIIIIANICKYTGRFEDVLNDEFIAIKVLKKRFNQFILLTDKLQILILISGFSHKMLENSEKRQSQFLRVQGDVCKQ